MMKVLEEQGLPCADFFPAASERSVGKTVAFRGQRYRVCSIQEALDMEPHLALFSAGSAVSREWAPRFAERGGYVIDNSSAWRMDDHVPLVVPEANPHTLTAESRIIANPNCSTIQLVVVLAPLLKTYGIRRLVISTYQSVTGTGVKAVRQLENERAGTKGEMAYPWPIDLNCFPHGGDFLDNGYTTEEMKLVHETRKILEAPELPVTASVVRIPVTGGHSEAVNIELASDFKTEEIRQLLSNAPGIVVRDNPAKNEYPMPLFAKDTDGVYVGRIRRDHSVAYGLDLWIVADNLRKGAATNAVQIAQQLYDMGVMS